MRLARRLSQIDFTQLQADGVIHPEGLADLVARSRKDRPGGGRSSLQTVEDLPLVVVLLCAQLPSPHEALRTIGPAWAERQQDSRPSILQAIQADPELVDPAIRARATRAVHATPRGEDT